MDICRGAMLHTSAKRRRVNQLMKEPPSLDPTSSLSAANGRTDEPPPVPAHELPQPVEVDRSFEAEGKTWIARLGGKGACGTGAHGLGFVEAVHFFASNAPERPLLEVLLPRGRFGGLFDSELAELLAQAIPIVQPEEH
jgi:hypothetical protein